jgi:hypothetical protein
MKKSAWLLAILSLVIFFSGCNSKGGNQSQRDIDKALALKFLQGIQDGDKKIMYEATNLTTEIVDESREKLIYPAKYKQTDQQRQEFQHVLRMSGEIDFFVAKMRPMFPKSASFQIIKTTSRGLIGSSWNSVHQVKITYSDKAEAMSDKTGKPVREMVIRLQQLTRSVNGRMIHELSFSSKDFEKMADKDFEVLTRF